MTELKKGDRVKAVMYGQVIEGTVTEITTSGCFLDLSGLNFAHRDAITHINDKEI